MCALPIRSRQLSVVIISAHTATLRASSKPLLRLASRPQALYYSAESRRCYPLLRPSRRSVGNQRVSGRGQGWQQGERRGVGILARIRSNPESTPGTPVNEPPEYEYRG
jgi:hypothetical protein